MQHLAEIEMYTNSDSKSWHDYYFTEILPGINSLNNEKW